MKPANFDLDSYKTAMETPCDIERAARLLATVKAVATECENLTQPSPAPDSTTEAARAPFTVLLNNDDSPYRHHYPSDYELAEKGYLRSEGYSESTIKRAIDAKHDKECSIRHTWRWPSFGFFGHEIPSSRFHRRTVAITVERPDIAQLALKKGWGVFDAPRRQAALKLVLQTATTTPEIIKSVQSNLDSWKAPGAA